MIGYVLTVFVFAKMNNGRISYSNDVTWLKRDWGRRIFAEKSFLALLSLLGAIIMENLVIQDACSSVVYKVL